MTKVYLGRPGDVRAFTRAPNPGASVDPTAPIAVHTSANGGISVDRSPLMRRAWSYAWDSMDRDDAVRLYGLHTRAYGRGPFVLIDPESGSNLLPENVSTASSALGSTAGFLPTVGAVAVAARATTSPFGSRIAWTGVGSSGLRLLKLQSRWASTYVPVPADGPSVMGLTLRVRSSLTTTTARGYWQFFNEALVSLGAWVSSTTPIGTSLSTIEATVDVPAGAAWALGALDVQASLSSPTVYVESAQMWLDEAGTEVAPSWLPGYGGAAKVSIVSLPVTPDATGDAMQVSLQEVG